MIPTEAFILLVFLLGLALGALAMWWPTRRMRRRIVSESWRAARVFHAHRTDLDS